VHFDQRDFNAVELAFPAVNDDGERERRRMVERVRTHLVRRRSPQRILGMILVVTATAGFLASVVMLKLGVEEMWVRYPLAVLAAWGVFLLLVRLWAEMERDAIPVGEDGVEVGPGELLVRSGALPREYRGSGRWLDYLEPVDADAEGCVMLLLFALALGALWVAIAATASLFAEADLFLAEVFLDVVLVSALYHRLRRLKPRWWMASAMRQTMRPVIATAVFLLAVGLIFDHSVPGAKSIGAVWRPFKVWVRARF
jgi:hypothetical protein